MESRGGANIHSFEGYVCYSIICSSHKFFISEFNPLAVLFNLRHAFPFKGKVNSFALKDPSHFFNFKLLDEGFYGDILEKFKRVSSEHNLSLRLPVPYEDVQEHPVYLHSKSWGIEITGSRLRTKVYGLGFVSVSLDFNFSSCDRDLLGVAGLLKEIYSKTVKSKIHGQLNKLCSFLDVNMNECVVSDPFTVVDIFKGCIEDVRDPSKVYTLLSPIERVLNVNPEYAKSKVVFEANKNPGEFFSLTDNGVLFFSTFEAKGGNKHVEWRVRRMMEYAGEIVFFQDLVFPLINDFYFKLKRENHKLTDLLSAVIEWDPDLFGERNKAWLNSSIFITLYNLLSRFYRLRERYRKYLRAAKPLFEASPLFEIYGVAKTSITLGLENAEEIFSSLRKRDFFFLSTLPELLEPYDDEAALICRCLLGEVVNLIKSKGLPVDEAVKRIGRAGGLTIREISEKTSMSVSKLYPSSNPDSPIKKLVGLGLIVPVKSVRERGRRGRMGFSYTLNAQHKLVLESIRRELMIENLLKG